MPCDGPPASDESVEITYAPDEEQPLSDAVLAAIEEFKGVDLTKSEFVLYDDIEPDALDRLFASDAGPSTTVEFLVDDVRVRLWGDGGVQIQITAREARPGDDPRQ